MVIIGCLEIPGGMKGGRKECLRTLIGVLFDFNLDRFWSFLLETYSRWANLQVTTLIRFSKICK